MFPPFWRLDPLIDKDWSMLTGESEVVEVFERSKGSSHLEIDRYTTIALG